jgi:uncharacterized protein (TIGR02266 family)
VIPITRAGLRLSEIRPMHHDRIRTSIPVEIRTSGRVAEGTVRNASDGGLFVETRAIPPQGDSVSLRFYPRSEARVEISGLVWWTTEGSPQRHRRRGFGLRLLEDDARYSKLLAGLRPGSGPTRRIPASQRKTLAAASGGIRGSGRSPRSR